MTHSQPTPGFEWKFREDGWATHQPVLYEAIKRSQWSDPIIELGMGYNSTALIHTIAGDKVVISADHDPQWVAKFAHLDGGKRLIFQLNWEQMLKFAYIDNDYSVVFVDQGDWQSRADSLKVFANIAELVVLHDSDYLEREGLIQFKDFYKFEKTFMPLQPYPYMTGPPTTIMSNFVDVTTWEINYEDYK